MFALLRMYGVLPEMGEQMKNWRWPVSMPGKFYRRVEAATTLRELGVEKSQLKEIADSCGISQGGYKVMTHKEILAIFQECFE